MLESDFSPLRTRRWERDMYDKMTDLDALWPSEKREETNLRVRLRSNCQFAHSGLHERATGNRYKSKGD